MRAKPENEVGSGAFLFFHSSTNSPFTVQCLLKRLRWFTLYINYCSAVIFFLTLSYFFSGCPKLLLSISPRPRSNPYSMLFSLSKWLCPPLLSGSNISASLTLQSFNFLKSECLAFQLSLVLEQCSILFYLFQNLSLSIIFFLDSFSSAVQSAQICSLDKNKTTKKVPLPYYHLSLPFFLPTSFLKAAYIHSLQFLTSHSSLNP